MQQGVRPGQNQIEGRRRNKIKERQLANRKTVTPRFKK